jgi:hypothetical protein
MPCELPAAPRIPVPDRPVSWANCARSNARQIACQTFSACGRAVEAVREATSERRAMFKRSDSIDMRQALRRGGRRADKTRSPHPLRVASAALAALLSLPLTAHASFLPPEMVDSAATYLAWFIIVVVPIAGVVVFWLVHILPEKAAEKRHHPQKEAITVLCLLSLVFGGLLWPLAWLWAYTKPIGYRAAYGTDKHEDYFLKMAELAQAGQVGESELRHLRDELDAMAAQGTLSPELREARARLASASPATMPAGTAATTRSSVTGAV